MVLFGVTGKGIGKGKTHISDIHQVLHLPLRSTCTKAFEGNWVLPFLVFFFSDRYKILLWTQKYIYMIDFGFSCKFPAISEYEGSRPFYQNHTCVNENVFYSLIKCCETQEYRS